MKLHTRPLLLVAFLHLPALTPGWTQGAPGGGPMPMGGAAFNTHLAKLFGENAAFSATVEVEGRMAGDRFTMTGQLAFLDGKSRFAVDLAQMKGGRMPPDAAAQMKSMGMSEMIMITRSDKKVNYLVYPGLRSYAENPMPEQEASADASKFKLETTEVGKETLAGHPCVKNKVVVSDDKGGQHKYTVWNATDLKQFPIRIEMPAGPNESSMTFKEVKFDKPEVNRFDPPADFTRYTNLQTMMQEAMMKRFSGSAGAPPPSK